MANLDKIKRRGNLGAPPSMEEASQNLSAPEGAPVVEPLGVTHIRVDGRSLRRTNRTVQFATKVTQGFDERFRTIAERDDLGFCDLLEKCLEAYESKR